jgi:hypothetical protein
MLLDGALAMIDIRALVMTTMGTLIGRDDNHALRRGTTRARRGIDDSLRLTVYDHFGTAARRIHVNPTDYFPLFAICRFLIPFNDHDLLMPFVMAAFFDDDLVFLIVIIISVPVPILFPTFPVPLLLIVLRIPVRHFFDDHFPRMIFPGFAYRHLAIGKAQGDFGGAIGCFIVIGPRVTGQHKQQADACEYAQGLRV